MPAGLSKESVELRVGIYDAEKHELQVFERSLKEKIDPQGRVRIETFDPY